MIGVDLFWLLYMVSSYQKVIKKSLPPEPVLINMEQQISGPDSSIG